MPKKQPSNEELLARFEKEITGTFYEVFLLRSVRELGQPSIAEIRAEMARIAGGRFVRTEASDKQLIGRMDTTFGLLECVGGSGIEKRFRVSEKGAALLDDATQQAITPIITALQKS